MNNKESHDDHNLERWTVHFTGRVQGVGFRATTSDIARHFEVTGQVRNLPDGRVRLVAEGEASQLEAFVDRVRNAMDRYIENDHIDKQSAVKEFNSFGIG